MLNSSSNGSHFYCYRNPSKLNLLPIPVPLKESELTKPQLLTPNQNEPWTHSSSISSCLGSARFCPPLCTPTSALFLVFWVPRFGIGLPALRSSLRPGPSVLPRGESEHDSLHLNDSPVLPPWLLLFPCFSWALVIIWIWSLGSPWSIKLPSYLLSEHVHLAWKSILGPKFSSLEKILLLY